MDVDIKEYLKENLKIAISMRGIRLRVDLLIENEEIDHDYIDIELLDQFE